MVRLNQGNGAFDRYAYVNNNPKKANDPSGHIPISPPPILDWTQAFFGGVDYTGIVYAESVMNKTESIEVAAGLAVQGEYAGVLDYLGYGLNLAKAAIIYIRTGETKKVSSGWGLAQSNAEEVAGLGLGNLDPFDPRNSATIMEARIKDMQSVCYNCTPEDLLIVAALAQNRALNKDELKNYAIEASGKGIDWKKHFSQASSSNIDEVSAFREWLTGKKFNLNFILSKYLADLRALHERGWALPDGITEGDLDEIYENYGK